MKKYILDLKVTSNEALHNNYFLLKLTTHSGEKLPSMSPGQFVEIRVDGSPNTFLRRPISINFIDDAANELWLLIQKVGEGTQALSKLLIGASLNLVLPLGNTFSMPQAKTGKVLLIGGGVGTAPMLYWGSVLAASGYHVTFLLGARSHSDLLQLEHFSLYGRVLATTEDGSFGEEGYVTQHSVLQKETFDFIYTCGPKPMMMAVASYASKNQIECEVSLENTMACGIGVCLCCVEKTQAGHVCVCTDGPIFNIKKLTWQI